MVPRPSQTCPRFVSDVVLKFESDDHHAIAYATWLQHPVAMRMSLYIYGHSDYQNGIAVSADIPLFFNSSDEAGSCRHIIFYSCDLFLL